jgi:hypothetical protein
VCPDSAPAVLSSEAAPFSGTPLFAPSMEGRRPLWLVAFYSMQIGGHLPWSLPDVGCVVRYLRVELLFPFSHGGRPSGIFEQIPRRGVRYLNGMEKRSRSSRMAWFLLFTGTARSWRPQRWSDTAGEVLET